ncbi:thump domain-containing protein [Phascolomyces articulosus]|uniref:Thump domain-containing protein n=1 Tax=Phascolomyces articulosus TaxID=60185 RepID=A0AAD5KFX2_9FUNG|nr:thump domain-containing protein [Phascolomyces articulosus]
MKRASQSNEHRKKRTKQYHCSKERTAGGGGGNFQVQANMSGIMVTCTRSKESRAQKEVIDLFEEYARKLHPDNNDSKDKEEDNDDEEEELDLEAQVAKELAELKQPAKDNKRTLFANIPTNMDCVLFIKARPPVEPVQFVHKILTDLKEDKKQRTRYTSRFLPVENTCHANLNAIEKMAEPIFESKFKNNSKSFAIICRIRNCTKLDRMEVVQKLASVVGEGHRVDLENPDLAIIVEICQNICMMSVVEDFNELKKYNIESILGLNDGGPPKPKNKPKPKQEEE